MLTADAEGKLSRDSSMRLFDKSPETPTTMTTTMTTTTTERNASPVNKLYQKFNISSLDKHKLAMELMSMMDTRQKEPLMRELVKGSTIIVECHNNQPKLFTFHNAPTSGRRFLKKSSINLFEKLSTRWELELIQ
jgi:hypothetical protein